MKDRELCTNNTTACNGKKGKQSNERRKTKKPGLKISLISLERALGYPFQGLFPNVHNLFIYRTILLKSVKMCYN